jgi:acyl-coenzyme A thioesterase 13
VRFSFLLLLHHIATSSHIAALLLTFAPFKIIVVMEYKHIEKGKILQWIKDNYVGKLMTDSRSHGGNWLQLTLESIDKGRAGISLPVRREMTNPYGNIHGGMMSLVIDECIGWAVVSLDAETHYTSLNLSIDFLYAIKEGERLKAESVIIREGKKIVNAECTVYDMTGRILAKAHSNLIATSMQVREGTKY